MSETKLKFFRVQSLPEQGEIGSLYFVYSGVNPKLYVYTADGFEQYSDLFDRDFSTLSVDALANAGDGVVYFTPDTHLIIKDGVVYGYEDLAGYATEQWVENKGYLTEHLDISGKVDVTDFEKATLVTSAALNKLHQNLLWNSEQVYVKCDKTKTQEEALIGDPSVIYFTTDTNCIITNGQQFGAVAKVIDNDSITQMVLGTTSLKEAYLAPFDEDTSNQLNDIIYGTDTNID